MYQRFFVLPKRFSNNDEAKKNIDVVNLSRISNKIIFFFKIQEFTSDFSPLLTFLDRTHHPCGCTWRLEMTSASSPTGKSVKNSTLLWVRELEKRWVKFAATGIVVCDNCISLYMFGCEGFQYLFSNSIITRNQASECCWYVHLEASQILGKCA